MGKYHDQEYIQEVVTQIKSKSKKEQSEIIKSLQEGYDQAMYEVDKINSCTAPEEITRRKQALYYYLDLFEKLKINIKDSSSALQETLGRLSDVKNYILYGAISNKQILDNLNSIEDYLKNYKQAVLNVIRKKQEDFNTYNVKDAMFYDELEDIISEIDKL